MLVASALTFFIAPVNFALNVYYCFIVIPEEARFFHPIAFEAALVWLSLVVVIGMPIIAVFDELD